MGQLETDILWRSAKPHQPSKPDRYLLRLSAEWRASDHDSAGAADYADGGPGIRVLIIRSKSNVSSCHRLQCFKQLRVLFWRANTDSQSVWRAPRCERLNNYSTVL